MSVEVEAWTLASTNWRSLQLVVVQDCQAEVLAGEHLEDTMFLPWGTKQPTAPLLEVDVTERSLQARWEESTREGESPLQGLASNMFSYLGGAHPLPILTIRLPTEKHRLHESMLRFLWFLQLLFRRSRLTITRFLHPF